VLISRLRAADSVRVQLRTSLRDATGRAADDIPLQEDDEVRVFSVTDFRATEYVAITGAVRRPGRYAYREGMTLRDLVLLADGLDARASVREAEIARLPRSRDGGRLALSQRVALDSSYLLATHAVVPSGVMQAGSARDVTLEPYDNVLIMSQPDWDRPRRVVLSGEVQLPGTYTLLSKGDRITDVLRRAGGLTSAAYAGGAVFYRRDKRLGRIGVDLPRVLRDSMVTENLVLQDGDSIHVPQFTSVVEVQGAVNSPRGVAWVKGANLDYYVRAAGGTSRLGDVDHAYVTQPNGQVESVRQRRFLPNDLPVPLPGGTVFVTEKDQPDRTDSVARLGALAQILGGLVALVAITRR
jgi:polysaccharide export outer membrane protein